MEGLVKIMPCNGKGETIEESYIKFDEKDFETIISEGINDKNQKLVLEINDADKIENSHKYNFFINSFSAQNISKYISYQLGQALVERIDGFCVYVIVTGHIKREMYDGYFEKI